MRFTDDFLERLRDATEIEDLISSYVNLRRTGRNLVGLCPFHSEKTPSFVVYPETQSFYCFGCHAGGDAVGFVKEMEHLDYPDAIKFLAQRAGVALPEEGMDDTRSKKRLRILEANREAARFFHESLLAPHGKSALEYLINRGLTPSTVKRFGIGYAPAGWDGLYKHLSAKGFNEYELFEAFLCGKGRNGGFFDQFRNRIMFPILDTRGNVIGFGGRNLGENGPKYLNSAQTPVFNKSVHLYALHIAKATKSDFLVLAEGYMDVVAIHQAGFDNAVATLGTSLTPDQARLISRCKSKVVIAYDSDKAGQSATTRAIELLKTAGLDVRVLKMEGAKDPDEYIKRFGAARFGLLLFHSGGAVEYELEKVKVGLNLENSEEKIEYLRKAAVVLSKLPSKIERDVYASKLSAELGVTKNALLSSVEGLLSSQYKKVVKRKEREQTAESFGQRDKLNPQKREKLGAAKAEETIIAALFHRPELWKDLQDALSPEDFITDFNRSIFARQCDVLRCGKEVSLWHFSEDSDNARSGRLAKLLADCKELTFSKEGLMDCITVLKEEKDKKSSSDVASMNDSEYKLYIESLIAKKKKEKGEGMRNE